MPSSMQRFWDSRADEDAFFFVDNRLSYGRPDLDRFWADGERDLDALLGILGVTITPDDHVLEIGCGVGRLTRALASRAASVEALDVSERMLELARAHNPQLENVRWLRGDGLRLNGVATGAFDVCVSHVVFQHIPDPEITLGYVRDIGRVLRPGGWAAFQISNDPRVHRRRPAVSVAAQLVRTAVGRAPRGQRDRHWLGSMVDVPALRDAAGAGAMAIERLVGEGTQFCCVLTRRSDRPSEPA
jgi:SAM-dependent methyltransferase